MDRMVHDFFDGAHFFPAWRKKAQNPPIDIIESENNFQLNVDLAGVNPDDIDVSVTDGFVTIQGEKEEEAKNKEGSYLYQETQYGSFQRTMSLPDTANCDGADAHFKNGLLKIIIPKKTEALQKPRKITIKKAA
jgi:HSP20 family protein